MPVRMLGQLLALMDLIMELKKAVAPAYLINQNNDATNPKCTRPVKRPVCKVQNSALDPVAHTRHFSKTYCAFFYTQMEFIRTLLSLSASQDHFPSQRKKVARLLARPFQVHHMARDSTRSSEEW
jgi:hypothetical protein